MCAEKRIIAHTHTQHLEMPISFLLKQLRSVPKFKKHENREGGNLHAARLQISAGREREWRGWLATQLYGLVIIARRRVTIAEATHVHTHVHTHTHTHTHRRGSKKAGAQKRLPVSQRVRAGLCGRLPPPPPATTRSCVRRGVKVP